MSSFLSFLLFPPFLFFLSFRSSLPLFFQLTVLWNASPLPWLAMTLQDHRWMLEALVRNPRPPVRDWDAQFPEAIAALRKFLGQDHVGEAATWKQIFAAQPPRKTLIRLCSALQVKASRTIGFVCYRNKREFKQEIKRILAWYSQRKRSKRLRKGRLLRGRRKAVTQKVKNHLRRMTKKHTFQGLWNWRLASQMTRQAALAVRQGTLPVEQFWAIMSGYIPPSCRRLSSRWLHMIGQLAFVRYNWQLFSRKEHSAFSQRDAMFEQKIHVCHQILTRMSSGTLPQHLEALVRPFLV